MRIGYPVVEQLRLHPERILSRVDLVEYKGTGLTLEYEKPSLFHTYVNIAHPDAALHLQSSGAIAFARDRGCEGISFHIAASTDCILEMPTDWRGFAGGSLPTMPEEIFVSNARRTVEFLRSTGIPVIAAENSDYIEGGGTEYICNPGFISDFCEEMDVDLLLDVGHAAIAASRLGWRIQDYLDRLPLSRVAEIHLHSPAEQEGVLRDAHGLPDEEAFAALDYALELSAPGILVLEVYDRPEETIEALERLQELYAGSW